MNNKLAIIISGGDFSEEDYRSILKLDKSYYLICADSGLDNALKYKLKPDLVLGDFDSISNSAKIFIRNNNIKTKKFPVEKDMSDTEIAINEIISLNYKRLFIYGVIGSRFDHSLSNILNIFLYEKNFDEIKIFNKNNIIFPLKKENLFVKDDYNYSILPLESSGAIVDIYGFYYSGKQIRVKFGSSLALSNFINEDFGKIILNSGTAVLIKSKD